MTATIAPSSHAFQTCSSNSAPGRRASLAGRTVRYIGWRNCLSSAASPYSRRYWARVRGHACPALAGACRRADVAYHAGQSVRLVQLQGVGQ